MRYLLATLTSLFLALCPAIAWAQSTTFGNPNLVISAYKYLNITTDTTTTVKSAAGILHTICINTPAATETLTVYDNTSASGTKIGTLTEFASVPGCFIYDTYFANGLTIVSATAAGDITIAYQ